MSHGAGASPREEPAVVPRALGSGYLMEAEIGGGATGQVWRGRRRFDDAPVAIKVLRAEFASDTDSVVRFLRQRTVLPAVSHPHLVRVHDLVAEGDVVAVVMDLVEGEDLRRVLKQGSLTRAQSLEVIVQIADALAAVHAAGVVHRDVKPENVLMRADSDRPHAMLTDFGLAKVLDSPVWTSSSQLNGTPAYLAPEVVSGRPAGPSADVYALAVTAYEMLAGRRPFQAANTAALLLAHLDNEPARPEGMPDGIWAVLRAGLAKEPESRPTAREFASALLSSAPIPPPVSAVSVPSAAASSAAASSAAASSVAARSQPSLGADELLSTLDAARPAPPPPVPPKPKRRRWILWTSLALCVVLGIGAGLWSGRPKPTPPAKPSPTLHTLFVPVTATTTKAGEIQLTFASMKGEPGFDSYLIYRDRQPVQQIWVGDSTNYTYVTDDHETEFCFEVAALLLATSAPAPLTTQPACLAANGKPRE